MSQMTICFAIFLFVVVNFIWGKLSMSVTALSGMILLVLTGCMEPEVALSGFSNSSTIILAAMFVISAGFSKTQMVTKLSALVKKISGGSFTKILMGYVLITALLSQVIQSAMAVFSIMFPLVCAVCDELEISRSKVFFSIGLTSISTVSILPIGGAAVLYAQYNGYLETYQYTDYVMNILDPTIARLPMLLFVVVYAIFIAPKFAPAQPTVALKSLEPRTATAKAPP